MAVGAKEPQVLWPVVEVPTVAVVDVEDQPPPQPLVGQSTTLAPVGTPDLEQCGPEGVCTERRTRWIAENKAYLRHHTLRAAMVRAEVRTLPTEMARVDSETVQTRPDMCVTAARDSEAKPDQQRGYR